MLEIVNEVRLAGLHDGTTWHAPSGLLTWDERLAAAAQEHAVNMANRGYIDHVDHYGRSPFMRITDHGYVFQRAAENISAGKERPEDVVAWWLESPGHRANLLHPDFVHTGVGLATAHDPYRYYWAQTFARPFS